MNIKEWASKRSHLFMSCFIAVAIVMAGAIMFGISSVVETEHRAFQLGVFCRLAPPQDAMEREAMRPHMDECVQNAAEAVMWLNDWEAELLAEKPVDYNHVDQVNSITNAKMREFKVVKDLEKRFFPPAAPTS